MGRLSSSRPCEICGIEFRPKVSNVNKGCGKTCSVKCRTAKASASRRPEDIVRGVDHPFYKDGHYVGQSESSIARRAHQALQRAVRRGVLQRGPCEGCGTTTKVEGHHDDLTKVLEVRWLCFTCHRAHHLPDWLKRAEAVRLRRAS